MTPILSDFGLRQTIPKVSGPSFKSMFQNVQSRDGVDSGFFPTSAITEVDGIVTIVVSYSILNIRVVMNVSTLLVYQFFVEII